MKGAGRRAEKTLSITRSRLTENTPASTTVRKALQSWSWSQITYFYESKYRLVTFEVSWICYVGSFQMWDINLSQRWMVARSAAALGTAFPVLPLGWCRVTGCGRAAMGATFWAWLKTTTRSASRSQTAGSCHAVWTCNCRSACTRFNSRAVTTRWGAHREV